MSKNTKIIIAVVLVILVIVLCFSTMGKNKENENEVKNENLTVTNEIVEDEAEMVENVTEVKPQGSVYESNSNAGTTDKKQDAIALVKEKWGEDESVTFRCDSVSNNGEYIIAVVSKDSASVKNYFKVNLETKTVEVDY